jgi:hypothetical protein
MAINPEDEVYYLEDGLYFSIKSEIETGDFSVYGFFTGQDRAYLEARVYEDSIIVSEGQGMLDACLMSIAFHDGTALDSGKYKITTYGELQAMKREHDIPAEPAAGM